MSKRWSKTELSHLKRHAGSQTLEELAQRFHTDTAEVRAKMEELGLAGSGGAEDHDAALESFESALALVHGGKWQQAVKALEQVIAESDTHELSDRARQFLHLCQSKLEGEPETEDPYLAAVVSKNRGDFAGARKLVEKQGKAVEKEERFAYLLASLHALQGEEDDAIQALGRAIQLEPRNRVQAYHDPDFKELREHDEFRKLLEPAQA